MDFAVHVDVGGALTALDDVAGRGADLTPVWVGPVDQALRAMEAEVWATEGASIQAPWAPLAPLTLALKARAHRAGMGPLKFSQALYRSLTVRSSPDGVREATPTAYTFGSRDPKAARHQTGWLATTIFGRARRQPVEVPARQVIPEGELPPTTLDLIYGAVIDYVVDGRV